MGDVISMDACRLNRQDRWLSQVSAILKARYSITCAEAGWTPETIPTLYASGLPPEEFVSRHFGRVNRPRM